jgi:hypothetical protein
LYQNAEQQLGDQSCKEVFMEHRPAPDSWESRFSRQRGFLQEALYQELRGVSVFIPGLGAIGSAVVQTLARTGIGRFVLIDPDIIGRENVAGQALATTETIGMPKVEAAALLIKSINPDAVTEIYPIARTVAEIEPLIAGVDVVILGMDTLSGGLAGYRAARNAGVPVVDFLYFPTPNVTSTLPEEEMPEERFGYPTIGVEATECDTWEIVSECLLRVLAYGFASNPGLLDIAEIRENPFLRAFLRLEGSVPSFAPLTMEVGVMMAREALAIIARERGLVMPRLGRPAFYVDTFRGRGLQPISARLSDLPDADAVMDTLRMIRDRDE